MRAVKIKAAKPPEQVKTAREALRAYSQINHYRDMAEYARAQSHRYTGGTESFRRYGERADAYDDVAEEWERVFVIWLRAKAGEELP